ncbi:GGDEF domain-containing protein [Craterilacuibacter sp.]|uniref:GGDEF domain-containing protein n=1 Tax=Craterilacuibacter sp. TaxID=2870909 RepID=UPI003F30A308
MNDLPIPLISPSNAGGLYRPGDDSPYLQTAVHSGARSLHFRLLRLPTMRKAGLRLALAWFFSLIFCLVGEHLLAAGGLKLVLPLDGEPLLVFWAPSMLLATLWTLWFGIAAGGSLMLLTALFSGWLLQLPLLWLPLYALTRLLGLLVLYLGYRAVPVRPDLAGRESVLFFLMMAVVSATVASLDTLMTLLVNYRAGAQLLALWLGHWLGLLANIGVFLLVLGLLGTRIEIALDHQPYLSRRPVRLAYSLWTTALLLAALLAYVFLAVRLHRYSIEQAFFHYERIGWPAVALSALQTLQVIHIVLSVLVIFIAYFFYKILAYWTGTLEKSARQLILLNQKLTELALSDELTGLYNRRHFMDMATRELSNAERHHMPCSLLLLDIDHFKLVNDQCGHLGGDQVLREIGRLLPQLLRPSDLAARYGGEELVVLLRHTPLEEALEVAERIRLAIASLEYEGLSKSLRVTVSAGVAESRVTEPDLLWLIERADRALYRAKDGGRNRVECDLGAIPPKSG